MAKIITVGVVTDQFGNLQRGGAEIQAEMTCKALENTGEIKIMKITPKTTSLDNIDLIHFFKSKAYYTSLTKILNEKYIPYVVSTIAFPTKIKQVTLYQRVIEFLPKKVRELFQTGLILRLWQQAKMLYPNTTDEANYLSKFNDPSKIEIIPNGLNFGELETYGSVDAFMDKYPQIKNIGQFVLNVGRIEPRKNQIRLLDACNRLNLPLVLIGKIGDQAYYNALLDQKSKNLFYLGAEYDKDILYGAFKACKLFCLPSLIETPGIVALEAAFYNKPIVITKYGGTKDYFADVASYVDPYSIKEIESAIRELWRNPLSTDSLVNNFNWDVIAQKYLTSYRKILSENS